MNVVEFKRRPPEVELIEVKQYGKADFGLFEPVDNGLDQEFGKNSLSVKVKDESTGREVIMIFRADRESADTFRRLADILESSGG